MAIHTISAPIIQNWVNDHAPDDMPCSANPRMPVTMSAGA